NDHLIPLYSNNCAFYYILDCPNFTLPRNQVKSNVCEISNIRIDQGFSEEERGRGQEKATYRHEQSHLRANIASF
ncbi:MAG: hypothetical protein KC964_28485, partial [Candidatus Omnitrophica bacterium]|nr:hypothetical protein [Candidatus Omnitrophota bacterium]